MTLSSDQQIVRLTVHGAPEGGTARDHIFEMEAGTDDSPLQVTEGLRTGFISGGSGLNTILGELLGSGESSNQDIVIDLGTSQFVLGVEFAAWEGSDLQWGDTGDSAQVTATDATGASAIEQMQVLMNTLNKVQIDSLPENLAGEVTGSYGPATVEFGMHHSNGPLDPLDVVVESPRVSFSGGRPSSVTGEMEMVLAADLGTVFDAQGNTKRGTGST